MRHCHRVIDTDSGMRVALLSLHRLARLSGAQRRLVMATSHTERSTPLPDAKRQLRASLKESLRNMETKDMDEQSADRP